jgi:succinylglutamate desuccinylase
MILVGMWILSSFWKVRGMFFNLEIECHAVMGNPRMKDRERRYVQSDA